MTLTIEQVQHIANLARLKLTDEELARYRDQLSAILEHFEQLQAADLDKILPKPEASESGSVLRQDEVKPGLNLNQLLANAPEVDKGQFRVPPVFDQGA